MCAHVRITRGGFRPGIVIRNVRHAHRRPRFYCPTCRRLESGVLSLPLCNETAILRVIVYWLSIRNEKVGKLRDKVGFCWTLCFDAWRPALDINIFCGTMDTAFSVNVYRFQFYCVSRTFVRYFLETDRLHILESRHGQNMLFKS